MVTAKNPEKGHSVRGWQATRACNTSLESWRSGRDDGGDNERDESTRASRIDAGNATILAQAPNSEELPSKTAARMQGGGLAKPLIYVVAHNPGD